MTDNDANKRGREAHVFYIAHDAAKAALQSVVDTYKPWQRAYPRVAHCYADVCEVVGEDNGGHPMRLFLFCGPDADKVGPKMIASLFDDDAESRGREAGKLEERARTVAVLREELRLCKLMPQPPRLETMLFQMAEDFEAGEHEK